MATTSSSNVSHVRSTSWSEDNNHPLSQAIKDHLLILTHKPNSSCRKLEVLNNMYEFVEAFLLSKTRKSFLEDVSDGFLDVLDICCTIRDVLMQIKEHVRELESSLRMRLIRNISRRDQEEFDKYVIKRRALSRTITKQMKNMKNKKKKIRDCNDDVNVMKKVEETSFNVLASLLIEVVNMNQNDYKQGLRSGGKGSFSMRKNQEVDVEKLRETELMIEEIERELECVYKKLLKTRVSLLNMLTI